MSQYFNVSTNAGDAAIASAIANSTKLNITHVAFGDGNGAVPTPDKLRTTLVNEVHRQPVNKYTQHPTVANWITVEAIIPSATGGFWIREIGIIADGVMISHGSHAPFFKVADTEGVSEYRLKFTIDVQDASVVQLTLDESLIFATQAWINTNYIPRSEIVDNLTTDDSTKPVSAKQAKNLQDNKLGKTETASAATKLATARSVSFSGAATGSYSYDGSGNSSCILTLANSGVLANTYGSALKIPVITVNAKGLVTVVSEQNLQIVDNLTTDDSTKPVSAKQAKNLQDNKLGKTETAAAAVKLVNDLGNAPSSSCRAWCALDGVTSVNILRSSNIALVTRVSEGIYDVSFINNMPSEYYVPLAIQDTSGTYVRDVEAINLTASGFRLMCYAGGSAHILSDATRLYFAVFG